MVVLAIAAHIAVVLSAWCYGPQGRLTLLRWMLAYHSLEFIVAPLLRLLHGGPITRLNVDNSLSSYAVGLYLQLAFLCAYLIGYGSLQALTGRPRRPGRTELEYSKPPVATKEGFRALLLSLALGLLALAFIQATTGGRWRNAGVVATEAIPFGQFVLRFGVYKFMLCMPMAALAFRPRLGRALCCAAASVVAVGGLMWLGRRTSLMVALGLSILVLQKRRFRTRVFLVGAVPIAFVGMWLGKNVVEMDIQVVALKESSPQDFVTTFIGTNLPLAEVWQIVT